MEDTQDIKTLFIDRGFSAMQSDSEFWVFGPEGDFIAIVATLEDAQKLIEQELN